MGSALSGCCSDTQTGAGVVSTPAIAVSGQVLFRHLFAVTVQVLFRHLYWRRTDGPTITEGGTPPSSLETTDGGRLSIATRLPGPRHAVRACRNGLLQSYVRQRACSVQ